MIIGREKGAISKRPEPLKLEVNERWLTQNRYHLGYQASYIGELGNRHVLRFENAFMQMLLQMMAATEAVASFMTDLLLIKFVSFYCFFMCY